MHDPRMYGIEDSAEEIVDARTAHSKLYRVDPYTRAGVFGNDMHYQEEVGGPWQEVLLQNCFLPDGGGGYRLRRVKQGGQFRGRASELYDRYLGRGIRIYSDHPVGPPKNGTQIESVKNGVTFTHTVTKRGMKMEAVVAARVAPQVTQYVYDYDVLGPGTDVLRANVDGSLSNSQVMLPRVTVVDAQGIAYEVGPWELLPGNQMAFSFDDRVIPPAGLPYVIDPTVTFPIGTGADDAQITKQNAVWANVPSATAAVDSTGTSARDDNSLIGGQYVQRTITIRWLTAFGPGVRLLSASMLVSAISGNNEIPLGNFYGPSIYSYNKQTAYDGGDWKDPNIEDLTHINTGTSGWQAPEPLDSMTTAHLDKTGGYTGVQVIFRSTPPPKTPLATNYSEIATFEHATLDEPRLTLVYLLPKRIGHVHG